MPAAASPRPRLGAPLQAFVLHRWDWSESSLILDLFTRERGRLAVAAKGAKRPYSQLRAVLLPFQRIHVLLGRTPADEAGEVHALRQAEWAGGEPMLAGSALFAGFYLNELLMRLLARQDPHPALFDAYAATLPALAVGDESRAQAALRAFELWLLRDTGVLPDLSLDSLRQEPVDENRRYRLQAESVVVAPASDPASIDGAALRTLAQALTAADLGALQAASLKVLPALRPALRGLLHYHLGPSALRTRQVLQGVQRLLEGGAPAHVPDLSLPATCSISDPVHHEPARRP
jgi:DNA repair protein RecO (recombination protein O)